jgi:hypothetical protein
MKLSLWNQQPLLLPLLVLGACATRSGNYQMRNSEELEDLKSSLKANAFRPCENISRTIKLTTPVREARILWHESKPVLVYEGAFQQAIKTVWQPLDEDLNLKGDGVVIGQRNIPHVTDFQTNSDALGGFWTTYRFKVPQSEIFAAAVEYLPSGPEKKNVVRLGMPQNRDSTVQRIWILPLPQTGTPAGVQENQRGIAHVIIKTVSILPGSIENAESVYTWYLLHASKSVVKKMGEYRPSANNISIENFFLSPETNDPLGVAISNDRIDSVGKNSSKPHNRILNMRPFAPNSPSELLHEDSRALSSFTAYSAESNSDMVHMAWLREPEEDSHPSIEMLSLPLSVPKHNALQKLSTKKAMKRSPLIKNIATPYFASKLEFTKIPSQSRAYDIAISWWGGNEPNQAFVFRRIHAENRSEALGSGTSLNPSHAFVSRKDLGFPMNATFAEQQDTMALAILYSETPRDAGVAAPGKLVVCSVPREFLQE